MSEKANQKMDSEAKDLEAKAHASAEKNTISQEVPELVEGL